MGVVSTGVDATGVVSREDARMGAQGGVELRGISQTFELAGVFGLKPVKLAVVQRQARSVHGYNRTPACHCQQTENPWNTEI